MRVLVTGSREWTDLDAIGDALLEQYELWQEMAELGDEFVVVHGAARGADTIAGRWAQEMHDLIDSRVRPEPHPADWDTYGKVAGHLRNHEMVSSGVSIALAFPLGKSPGTRGCMRLCRDLGIPVLDKARDRAVA